MPDTSYPSLSSLIHPDRLPAELGVVRQAIANFFDDFYYHDFQTHRSTSGDAGFYSLTVVTYRRLALEIPGTGGLAIILNPALDEGTAGASSEFPLSFRYKWGILAYTRDFSLDSFDDAIGSLFEIVLDITGVTKEQLLTEALSVLTDDPQPILQFVNLFNGDLSYAPAVPLQLNSFPTDAEAIVDLLLQLTNNGNDFDALQVILDHYITAAASITFAGDPLQRLERLFQKWIARLSDDKVKKLFILHASASIDQISVGLQFPRSVLREVDAQGNPVPDPDNPGEDKPAMLTCGVGSVTYSTDDGIAFEEVDDLSISVPRCEILHSGLILDIHEMKVDFSRTTNIAEATADGRPVDFVGVYVKDGTITFPAKWNPDPASTAVIKVRNLLAGTGGLSGTLALEAKSSNATTPVVKLTFGDNFSVSLDKFLIKLKQNAIVDSTIEGTLVIPGFQDANGNPAQIRIKVAIRQNGDFDITAHEDDGFRTIVFPGVFNVTLKSVFFGKQGDDFYLGVAGSIRFTHLLIADAIKDPVEVEKLIIWSDGRFEIEGGTIPLPQNLRFPIGPAEISISAIHLGSHQDTNPDGSITKFRYFGFDGALDVNPGGVDVRGKGIKFYFPVDGAPLSRAYLEIKSLAIDLVIPGSATRESAALLVSGYLSVGGSGGDPEYEGGVTFALPEAQIAGGASMKYRPKVPAFLVDATVDFSVPVPFGSTSLGAYACRGLFGSRYVATKHAAGLDDTKSWFDYYKVKSGSPPVEGISVSKLETPDQTGNYDDPISIGAGVALATIQDSGRAFSCKLFLLVSLPGLFYMEGKANIVGERVGLTGDDPMFFAVLAISSESVEIGAGVTYDLPKDGASKGQIVHLDAEMRAAFFFRNKQAWFIHIGTPEHPTTARIVSIFDAMSYLTLSASGIAAGAGLSYGFDKSYAGGLVRASVGVYIKVGGFISFQGPQIGGFAMLGGHVDVSLMRFGFYITIDTSLSVEVPKPFLIRGSVHLCVGITIGFKKFGKRIEKCFDVEFRWERDPSVDRTPVLPFQDPAAGGQLPYGAMNMLSGETFHVASFGSSSPSSVDPVFDTAVLPLDTWVDVEFLKGLIPSAAVDDRIGRLSGEAPANAVEQVPPAQVEHKVEHRYSITAFETRVWNGSAWADYRPYEAMSPPDALAALSANPSAYKDGFWINTGDGFNKIRLLAETSFSYMQQGQPGWIVPEQMGITSASLFCQTKLREEHCVDWSQTAAQTEYADGKWRQLAGVLVCVSGGTGRVLDWNAPSGTKRTLVFPNEATATLVLPKPAARVRVKLTTFSTSVTIRFLAANGQLADSRVLTQVQALAPIVYDAAAAPVTRIEIVPLHADPAAVDALQIRLDAAQRTLLESGGGDAAVRRLTADLAALRAPACTPGGIPAASLAAEIEQLKAQAAACQKEMTILQAEQEKACKAAHDAQDQFNRCFPDVPTTLSYSIANGQFSVHDDRTDTLLFSSTETYADDATAEGAFFASLDLARHAGAAAIATPQPGAYVIQLFERTRVAASGTAPFATADAARAALDEIRQIVSAPGFAPARRASGKLPCGHCPDHVECWDEIPIPQYDENCRPTAVISAHDAVCRYYDRLYRQLYASNLQQLQELEQHCDEATHALDQKGLDCAAISAQLAAAEQAAASGGGQGTIRPPDAFPCSTLLEEVCYFTLEDHEFNQTIPGQPAIEQDYQAAVEAIEKELTPIWRPHARYSIHLQVMDTVDGSATAPRDFYFGFRTAGPVGHFHTDPSAHYVDPAKSPDLYMLTGLKGYVDYRRSNPDPSGNVIGAKPLFYEDARILLFFTKRYVYHFFGQWPAYHGLPALTGNAMQIVIKDPAEKGEVPQAVVSWPRDDEPRIPEDVQTLVHLRNPELLNPAFQGGECWVSGGQMIVPASVHTEVVPQHLKPLKLYTAIVNNVDQGVTSEVLRYVFLSSRYPDFQTQIDSYRLDDGNGNRRDAVFDVAASLTPAAVQLMFDIVGGTMSPANAALAGRWADPFDRLIQGVLAQQPLPAAAGTEFNIVRNSNGGAVVAVWIRGAEPLNDTRVPDDVLPRTIKAMPGLSADPDYRVLFSKDRAEAFVMHPSRVIPVAQLKFRFAYVEWDGSDYIDHAVVTTGWIPVD